MLISDLRDRKVAIWGLGREGRAALELLAQHFPGRDCGLFDDQAAAREKETALLDTLRGRLRLGPCQLPSIAELRRYEVIIKSPGVSIYRPELIEAQAAGVIFTTGTNLWFAERLNDQIIAVTGTKGKSTTTALICHLLNSLGIAAQSGGNIGLPLLSTQPAKAPDYWILELSSYQIADLQYRPRFAVLSNLYCAHLGWHGSLEQYQRDKLSLFNGLPTNGGCILDFKQRQTLAKYPIQWLAPRYFNDPQAIHQQGDYLCDAARRLMPRREIPLRGAHNMANCCTALTVLKVLGADPGDAVSALSTFNGLPHRLQSLGVSGGIEYINDSIASVPEAVIAALEALADRPLTLILGGQELDQDWQPLAAALPASTVEAIVTVPDSGPRVAQVLHSSFAETKASRSPSIFAAGDLAEALALAQANSRPGSRIALSPGCPSYDHYRNFEERGRVFAELAGFQLK